MLGYAAYAERFAGDLPGVAEQVDYLNELGVTYLHLMPLLQPRDGPNDGGYAVANYRTVRADLGTIDDLRALATHAAPAGHQPVPRPRAQPRRPRARVGAGGPSRAMRTTAAYFHIFPDRELPDAYERTLPEVFPDFAPGSFTWDDDAAGWVWTTFNSWQWDLDWSNPDVALRVRRHHPVPGQPRRRRDPARRHRLHLEAAGHDVPEPARGARHHPGAARGRPDRRPAVMFKAEAIVAPADLVHYLGRGGHHGKVSDLAYHNSLMVQIWSMLASHDVRLSVHVLRAISEVPSTTAWVTYVRCHDDIGWAIDDADAAAVGLSGYGHRAFLSDYYSGEFWQSPARGPGVPAQRGRPATGASAARWPAWPGSRPRSRRATSWR